MHARSESRVRSKTLVRTLIAQRSRNGFFGSLGFGANDERHGAKHHQLRRIGDQVKLSVEEHSGAVLHPPATEERALVQGGEHELARSRVLPRFNDQEIARSEAEVQKILTDPE